MRNVKTMANTPSLSARTRAEFDPSSRNSLLSDMRLRCSSEQPHDKPIPGLGRIRFKDAKLVVVRGTNGYGALAIVAVLGVSLVILDLRTNSTSIKKKVELPTSSVVRASGFNAKGQAKIVDGRLKSILSAGGQMHSNEVIRFEAQSFLRSPDGKLTPTSQPRSTFSEKLIEEVSSANLPKGSKVVIRGRLFVYRREEVKVEREMAPDGSPKIYLNTGYITFKRTQTPNGPRVMVTCTNLRSVHEHGMEFMSADKKMVSARIIFTPGDQILDRESIPFTSKYQGIEPITIHQLIPKRTEPIELTVPISGL
jgi:hypothetical protein